MMFLLCCGCQSDALLLRFAELCSAGCVATSRTSAGGWRIATGDNVHSSSPLGIHFYHNPDPQAAFGPFLPFGPTQTFHGHTRTAYSVQFVDPASPLLVSVAQDWSIRVWDTVTEACVSCIGEYKVTHFSPEASRALVA
jgi:WD40 repeat protein